MTTERLEVWSGDITTLAVDAIVNAATNSLLGGGGVDGAIHRAAGPALLEFCRGLGGCATGEARLTPGFDLPAKWIIHTVGPVWRGGAFGESRLLAQCYRSCFKLMQAERLTTVAFPAISCGVYGYPAAQACAIAVEQCRIELSSNALIERIVLVAFDQKLASLLNLAVQSGTALR